jgi:formylglycine-generating enzyme
MGQGLSVQSKPAAIPSKPQTRFAHKSRHPGSDDSVVSNAGMADFSGGVVQIPPELQLDILEYASTSAGFLKRFLQASHGNQSRRGDGLNLALKPVTSSIHQRTAGNWGAAPQSVCDAHELLRDFLPPFPPGPSHGSATDGSKTGGAVDLPAGGMSLTAAYDLVLSVTKQHLAGKSVSSADVLAAHSAYDAIQPLTYSYVPVGPCKFKMGEGDAEHDVELTYRYLVGQAPVTQGQYRRVMGHNPSYFKDDSHGERASERPVEGVSFSDALVFCNKVSASENLPPYYRIRNWTEPHAPTAADFAAHLDDVECDAEGVGVRLLTEAEWECMAKGGGPGATYPGPDQTLNDIAWYYQNAEGRTHPIGRKEPNRIKIDGPLGGVWEWTHTRYGAYPPAGAAPAVDPRGPDTGMSRVIRGGSLDRDEFLVRASGRNDALPSARNDDLGFRLARSVPLTPEPLDP